MDLSGVVARAAMGAAALALLGAPICASPAAAGAVGTGRPSGDPHHTLPSYVLGGTSVSRSPGDHVVATEMQAVTDTPGNVYYQAPPPTLVNPPVSSPADLISATAADDGVNITFSARTVDLNDPTVDPNWRNNTYIGWAIDPAFSGTPKYFAYFQLNPNGTYNGELTYASNDAPVSCNVSLSFNTAVGYQAQVPTACLPGVTTFQWLAYTLYDTIPRTQDPNGSRGFGKALPDYRRNGGVEFAPPVTAPVPPSSQSASGLSPSYWLFARDGGVFTFGGGAFYGGMGGQHLNQPIVGGAATLDGQGYWLVASDGGVFTFGDARFYGSTGGQHLNAPIVAMLVTATGNGYWLVASDGGVFAFGGATFYGGMGGQHLNQPIVGGAATLDGQGYWLVARDGGVFGFGAATFLGSEGGARLNKPVVGMAADPSGGYWLIATDGGMFSFGGAPFLGSAAIAPLNAPVVGMAATVDGLGYRMVASDGGIFDFGSAGFFGSEAGSALNQPVVGMASIG